MTGEEEVLVLLGKIVAQWNYAEHCSRQIIRKQIPGGDINDPNHVRLSNMNPQRMEDELRDKVLPVWRDAPGEPYLQSLIAAFSSAREYRNYYVHGVWATVSTTPAQAVIVPSKPHNKKVQLPDFATAADLRPIAFHLETLGAFACKVGNAFDSTGGRATNKEGTFAIQILPPHIVPLPPFPYKLLVP